MISLAPEGGVSVKPAARPGRIHRAAFCNYWQAVFLTQVHVCSGAEFTVTSLHQEADLSYAQQSLSNTVCLHNVYSDASAYFEKLMSYCEFQDFQCIQSLGASPVATLMTDAGLHDLLI